MLLMMLLLLLSRHIHRWRSGGETPHRVQVEYLDEKWLYVERIDVHEDLDVVLVESVELLHLFDELEEF